MARPVRWAEQVARTTPLQLCSRGAAGGVGGRAAEAGEDGQVARVGGDRRVLGAGGGGHLAVGGQRAGPKLDRSCRRSLPRASRWRARPRPAARGQTRWALSRTKGRRSLDRAPSAARRRAALMIAVGRQALRGAAQAASAAAKPGRVGRAGGADLAGDQRGVGLPAGLGAPERRPGQGPQRGGVGLGGGGGAVVAGGGDGGAGGGGARAAAAAARRRSGWRRRRRASAAARARNWSRAATTRPSTSDGHGQAAQEPQRF